MLHQQSREGKTPAGKAAIKRASPLQDTTNEHSHFHENSPETRWTCSWKFTRVRYNKNIVTGLNGRNHTREAEQTPLKMSRETTDP
ncbi:MAG: hypothetical protein AAB369_01665, partial [Chloroflexota bacterium]